MNSLHHRFTFRQTLYTALLENGQRAKHIHGVYLDDVGGLVFETLLEHDMMP